MIPENQVYVLVNNQKYTYQLDCEYFQKYDELLQFICSIPNISFDFYIAGNRDGIPTKKITNDQDLDDFMSEQLQQNQPLEFSVVHTSIPCHDFIYGEQYADEITQEVQGQNFKGLFGDLATIKLSASKSIDLKQNVINFFMGITGEGKSTLVNLCQGINFECERVKGGMYHLHIPQSYSNQNVNIAEIGNGFNSETSLPGYYRSLSNEILCDLAGFIDTKGVKQEIRNSYSNTQIFKQEILLRIMIVVSYATIDAERGNGLIMTLKRITSLFKYDLDRMKNCSGIIVTKVSGDLSLDEIIEIIEEICKTNQNLNQIQKEYALHLVNLRKILIVCNPKKIAEGQYTFVNPQEVLNFIGQIGIGTLEKDAEISLSPEAGLQITESMKKLEDRLQAKIYELILSYPSHYLENNKEKLGLHCKDIDEASNKLQRCRYYPYDIDLLIDAIRILKIPIDIEKYQAIVGSLIKNLRRCQQLVPSYNFRTDMFQNIFSYLKQRWRHLFLKMNNQYDRVEMKEIAADQMKRIEQHQQYLEKRKKQILRLNEQRQRNNRQAVREETARLNRQLEAMNQRYEEQLNRLKRRLR